MHSPDASRFAIRTITAGVNLESVDQLTPIDDATRFLVAARQAFEGSGFVVQSTRISTQPLGTLLQAHGWDAALASLRRLDHFVADRGLLISIGPLLVGDAEPNEFPSWAADLVAATRETYFSVEVTDRESTVCPAAAQTAARTMLAISRVGANGEANFRFAAAARIPPSTPFFPVAHHKGNPTFSIGLESANLVAEACRGIDDPARATDALRGLLNERLRPVETLAMDLAATRSWRYAGIDLSPAPSVEVSIAAGIEELTRRPFGEPTTLAACASITRALRSTSLTSCGYSGLMLPLLEDRVLARRAGEGRFSVQDLLLYSTVCGTGLDVVPLPGDTAERDLAAVILDVAALAARLDKPLAARLLPIPGRSVGERVEFSNPHLTPSIVLPLG